MKKRMLSLALAVGMTLTTLTGCGSSTGASSSEGADGSATAADPVTTAAEQLLKHRKHIFRHCLMNGMT